MFKTIAKHLSFIIALGAVQANALPMPSFADFINPLPATFTADYDFEGIVALNNCSGSLVRFENSKDSDLAMVLTNGHCLEGGFMEPGAHVAEKSSTRSFTLLDRNAGSAGRVQATKIMYATMTKTDLTLYQLKKTFEQISSEYKVKPLTLSDERTTVSTPIEIISGYWKRGYRCAVQSFVHILKEEDYTWEDSLRYTQPGCETIGGTSGSPIVEAGTKTVIGVNNTGNENGAKCTMNNPCEVNPNGEVFYEKGTSYGQQTLWIYSCLNAENQIDLTREGCLLPH